MAYAFSRATSAPKDGRRLSWNDFGWHGIGTVAQANGFVHPCANGYYSDMWQGIGASASHEVRRNVRHKFVSDVPGNPEGAPHVSSPVAAGAGWTAPGGHTPGHYYVEFRRGTSVPYYGKSQGHGSYIVTRSGVNGYPALPSNSYGVVFGGGSPLLPEDNPYLAAYLGHGMSRMALKFSEYSGWEDKFVSWTANHKVAWDDYHDMDPARPNQAAVLTLADLNYGIIDSIPEVVLEAVTDPRMAWVPYIVPGNELNDNGAPEGGNLGPNLIPMLQAMKALLATVGLDGKMATPSNCTMHTDALYLQRQFFLAAKAVGLTFAARMIHAYNADLGDFRRGRHTWGALMADHMDPLLDIASLPIVHEEAGTFHADEYGAHIPLRQAWQYKLQLMLGDVYAGVHGLFAKENRIEFHSTPGFAAYPSEWMHVHGPFPIVSWALTDSQEKRGCSQTVESEFETDDPHRLIGAVHRRDDDETGLLDLMSTRRDATVRLHVPGIAGQTRTIVNAFGVESSVTFDSQSIAEMPAGGRIGSDDDARCPVYLRLGPGETVEYAPETRYGSRVPYGSVRLTPQNFATQSPRLIGPVRDRTNLTDLLALANGGNIVPDPRSTWRSNQNLDQIAGGEMHLLAEFPRMNLKKVAFEFPAPWHHMGIAKHLIVETWNGSSWQLFGERDESSHTTAHPWRTMGMFVTWDDGNGFDVTYEAGRVTNKARIRVLDLTAGSAVSLEALTALGWFEPVTDASGIVVVDENFHPVGESPIPIMVSLANAGDPVPVPSERWWWQRTIEFHGTAAPSGDGGSGTTYDPEPGWQDKVRPSNML